MVLLRNIALFFLAFLPAVAVVSMVVAAFFGNGAGSPSDLTVGWNPLLALTVTAPWLIPTVLIVPFLHMLGMSAANRFSFPTARGVVLVVSPAAFIVAVLILWGPENFRAEFVLPVAISGAFYGVLHRIPVEPRSGASESPKAAFSLHNKRTGGRPRNR